MRRLVSGILLALILVNMLPLVFGMRANETLEPSSNGPAVRVVEFNNGTREMITDYENGTRNCIAETFVKKTAELLTAPNETDQSVTTLLLGALASGKRANMMSLTSIDKLTKYANTTQTVVLRQPMMLGFTYTLAYWQEQWSSEGCWWIFTWYLAVGVDVDIQFGLRLPINVTVEYPEQMIIGNNYTIHVTLDPADMLNFDELLLTFKANIWAEANICGISIPRTVLIGPDIDGSQTFITPLGSHSAPLFLPLRFNIFDIIDTIYPDPDLKRAMDLISQAVVPYLVVQLTFGSNQITAKANATGDARVVGGADLNWSEPHQTLDFLVNADEYDSTTNYSRLILSDFKYYFTKFGADFGLEFDFDHLINDFLGIPDPILHLCTLDINWITNIIGTPYVTSHSGYPGSIYVTIYVERTVNPGPRPPPPEDVAISYAYAAPPKVYAGELANITVGAKNLGNMSETFNVTIYSDTFVIDRQLVTELRPGEEVGLSFGWNTTGFSPWHVYNISAEASEVPNEIDKDNNILSAGTVEIVLPLPKANFTYSPTPPIVNQTTTFNATVSIPGFGTIVSYSWNFGEGDNLTTANPVATHVFVHDGNHNVTLTVRNSEGLKDTVWEFISVYQSEGHDVTVVGVAPYRYWVYQGQPLNITVSVTNKGNFTESLEVRLYYNITANEEIGTVAMNLNPGENETLTFTLNTSGVPYCYNYTIIAAAGIPFDINPTDNIRESLVEVRMPGDVNDDFIVDIYDAIILSNAYNSVPASSNWNPNADINCDNIVDIYDAIILANHYNQHYP
jgi:PKD repeat protein